MLNLTEPSKSIVFGDSEIKPLLQYLTYPEDRASEGVAVHDYWPNGSDDVWDIMPAIHHANNEAPPDQQVPVTAGDLFFYCRQQHLESTSRLININVAVFKT